MTKHGCCMLLLVVLAGVGGCESSSAPEFDWTGLLTDEELRTEEDPDAPEENPDWAEWVEANNIPIRSLDANNVSDLLALRPYLAGKRIIQLGENGHGASEVSSVKVRLVKFLHEIMGFNVIAIESSFFECFYADNHVASRSAEDLMSLSIQDIWHTAEMLPLFKYWKKRHDAGSRLSLAGFDIRISSPRGAAHRPEVFRQVLAVADQDYADYVYELDSEFIEKRKDGAYFVDHRDSLIAEYEQVSDFIHQHEQEIADAFPERPEVASVLKQLALSIAMHIHHNFLEYTDQKALAFEARDEGMAGNLQFLLEVLYPKEKVIIWAHNIHVCRDYKAIPERQLWSAGRRISELYRPELYTIGVYMYRGSAANNDRSTADVPAAQSASIESILYRTRRKHCFIDMLGRSRNAGNSWMFETILSNEWDRGGVSLVPKDQYDALLFIDTVNPPDFLEV